MMDRIKTLFRILWRFALVVFFVACNAALAKHAGYIPQIVMTLVWIFVIAWLGALVVSFSYLFLRLDIDEMATLVLSSGREDDQ